MKKVKITAVVLFLLPAIIARAQNKWYVDSAGTGANNGSSWTDAFRYLSDATLAAQAGSTTDSIFVAKGTYYPSGAQSTGSSANRDTAFIFTRNNLAVLGGYPNGGGIRNAQANPTVLSGQINADTSLGSYHVIVAAGTSSNPLNNTLVFDGFKFTRAVGSTATPGSVIINTQTIYNTKGGGMYNQYASPTITNNVFSKLTSTNGAGIYNFRSSPRIINNMISGNTASAEGIGIYNDSLSSPVITNVVVSGNKGNFGGAISNSGLAAPRITNVTISGNSGYGLRNIGVNSPALKNCIIYSNNSSINNTAFPSLTTFANCLLEGINTIGPSIGIDQGNNINANPAFVTPYSSFWNTEGNFQLKITSPAIGKGDTTGVSQYLPATDLAGNSRIFGARIDMGAYEMLPSHIIYVDSSATAGNKTGDNWANALTSLSYATNVAVKEFVSIDTILIAKGTYFPSNDTTTLRDTTFFLTRSNLALIGGYPSGGSTIRDWKSNPVILSGRAGPSANNSDNLFHVILALGTPAARIDSSLILDGLTVAEGYSRYSGSFGYSYYDTINAQLIRRGMGGGIYMHYASPTIRNCNIINNGGDFGAGVYLYQSRSLFANMSIKGNTSQYSGSAMFNDSSSFTMVNSVISGNMAFSSSPTIANRSSNPLILNTTITGNFSFNNGVALENFQSSPVIRNSIIYANTADVYNDNTSFPAFSHSIIQSSGGSAAWVPATGVDSGFNLNTNPIFMVPIIPSSTAQTGGNFQIQFGSPAMEAGDTTNVSQYLPSVDMRNNPRITGNQIDIGAYEFGEPAHILYVDSSAVSGANNGTDWANALVSLSNATNIAGAYRNVDSILVAKGTYYPTRMQTETNRDASFTFTRDSLVVVGGYPSGGGSVRNSALNVTTLSGNIGNSTLSSDNSHHVIVAAGTSSNPLDSTLRIDGFTITGGNANIDTGSVVINSQAITRNIGGGMVNYYATPTLSNINITKDTASGNGGGMYNLHASPVIINGNFSLNTAKNGGAIFDTLSSPVITSGIFRGNKATNHGGAMYNISSSAPKISGSLFSGNNAASNGGAILNSIASAPTIVNTTIASNFAVNVGGGIINLSSSAPFIKNCIVYGNNSGITNVSSNPVVRYSIMQDGGYAGSNNNINQNPLFQTPLLAANVASTAGNFQLLAGSPAINAGDTTSVSQYLPLYDLIGFPRILGANIDMGAYEYVRALYVDSSVAVSGRGTSWTDAYKYFSDATNSARNVYAIDTIFTAKGTYYPTGRQNISNRDTSFIFTRSGTTIWGGYPNGGGVRDWVANPTILSGDIGTANDSTDNAYHVLLAVGSSSATPITNTLKIDGFTITGGNANNNTGTITVNGVTVPRNFGGGMLNYYAAPTLSNVTITKNVANTGGGIYNATSSPSITNATISANRATTNGGGLYNDLSPATINNVNIRGNVALGAGGGIFANSSNLVISNATIQDNRASTNGGGINANLSTPAFTITNTRIIGNTALNNGGGLNITNTGNTAALVIDNSMVGKNTAANNGGGIANANAAPTIRNSKISGNTAGNTYSGGGIYNTASSAIITNTVITGNTATNGGGIANTGVSASKVINTVVASNNATNGGGVYNFTSSAPVFKNSIIALNNTGVVNTTTVPLPRPVFSYSIIQGSGGSGAGWVTTTGADSGYNKAASPNFVNSIPFTSAPDTSGNYSITICSPAVNMGDTTGISQYIPALDMAGAPRFNGRIDAGAYEIDTLNPASMYVPVIAGIYTSTRSFQQGNLTHFCNCDSNKILVTLDTFGTGVVLTDTSAKVRAGAAVAAYYQAGSGFVTNPDGTAIFNREWAVTPLVEPTSPVTVYTYYTDSDYVSVNNVMNSLMLPPLVSDTQMYFYKVTDTSLGLFPSIFNIGINQVHIITYGPSPSVDHWVAGTLGSNKYAEYKVSSFSGGGGGGSAEGNTPLPIEILSLTGKAYTNYNMLNWDITDDITDWELSRSNNSVDFKVLSSGAAGIRSYKDEHPEKGISYYRLKVTSKRGSQAYSAIVALKSNTESGGITLYPVPASQSITIRCSNNALIGQKLTISDNVGRVVYSKTLQAESNIDISSWAAGMYHVTLPDGSSIKMIKK